MDEQRIALVLEAWDESEDEEHYAGVLLSHDSRRVLARQAVEALQCGATHPDRPAVRCTEFPHENGPLTHRNAGLRLEWWRGGGGQVFTVHDDLGKIELFPDTDRPASSWDATTDRQAVDQEPLNEAEQPQGNPWDPDSLTRGEDESPRWRPVSEAPSDTDVLLRWRSPGRSRLTVTRARFSGAHHEWQAVDENRGLPSDGSPVEWRTVRPWEEDTDQMGETSDQTVTDSPGVPKSVCQDVLDALASSQKAHHLIMEAYKAKRGLTAPLFRRSRDASEDVNSVLHRLQELSGRLAQTDENPDD